MFTINKLLSIPNNPNKSTDTIILEEVEKYIKVTYNIHTILFSVNYKEIDPRKLHKEANGLRYFHIFNAFNQRDK